MGYYILAGQNGIVRLSESTPSDVVGIGTKHINTCLAIILISEKKISLIHADFFTDPISVLDEIKWVGESYKIVLVKNQNAVEKTQQAMNTIEVKDTSKLADLDTEVKFIPFFKENKLIKKIAKRLNVKTSQIFVDRFGKITSFAPKDEILQDLPHHKLRYAMNFVNAIYHNPRPPVVEFDGKKIAEIPILLERSRAILTMLKNFLKETNYQENPQTLVDTINSIHKEIESRGKGIPDIPETCFEHFIQQLKEILDHSIFRPKQEMGVMQP